MTAEEYLEAFRAETMNQVVAQPTRRPERRE
jgi:hypothetical protein